MSELEPQFDQTETNIDENDLPSVQDDLLTENAPEYQSKTEYYGESKVEKGLSDFRIYRVARNEKLLHLEPNGEYNNPLAEKLYRGIFFTTQKNMAMEYRSQKKPVLLETTGENFLETVKKLENQGIQIVLFNHDDLSTYQKMLRGEIKNLTDINNFFQLHLYNPRDISLRALRKSAEIIALLPDGLDSLPLTDYHKTGIKSAFELSSHGGRRGMEGPGNFHHSVEIDHPEKDSHLATLKKRKKRLNNKKSLLTLELLNLTQGDTFSNLEYVNVKRSEIGAIKKQILDLNQIIIDYRKSKGHSDFYF